MPGTPIKRQLIARIDQIGGPEAIIERVASGETLTSIAAELGVSREALSGWMNRDEERTIALRSARARAAEALVDQTLQIADAASPQEAQVARLRIDTRQWIASRWNRAEYGQDKAAVEINIGSLHLDALRHTVAGPVIDVTPVESTT